MGSKKVKWLILAIQITVAVILVYSGIMKLVYREEYYFALSAYLNVFHSATNWTTALVSNVQPWLEILVGVLWLLPLSRVLVIFTTLMITVYTSGILTHCNTIQQCLCPGNKDIISVWAFVGDYQSLGFWAFMVLTCIMLIKYYFNKADQTHAV